MEVKKKSWPPATPFTLQVEVQNEPPTLAILILPAALHRIDGSRRRSIGGGDCDRG